MKDFAPYIISQGNSILEALRRLNDLSGKATTLFVVDDAGRLTGTLTDGDVRRAMQAYKADFFTTPVSEIMTPTPKTIHAKDRIVDAGEQMNHYSIHSLVVLNEQDEVVGVIDSFSCLPGTRFYH